MEKLTISNNLTSVTNSESASPDTKPNRNNLINIMVNKFTDEPDTPDSKDGYILDANNMIRKKLNKLDPDDILKEEKKRKMREKIKKVSEMHLMKLKEINSSKHMSSGIKDKEMN